MNKELPKTNRELSVMIRRSFKRDVTIPGSVFGFGVNDSDYLVSPVINGKQVRCPAYRSWCDMLRRAREEKFQQKHKTYIGVTVCDEWRSFMAFREWWLDNHVDGWHLDKDIIGNGKEYSKYKCIYVPSWLNCFLINNGARRGDFPLGVSFAKRHKKYASDCRNPLTGSGFRVGYFDSANEAHEAWVRKKISFAYELKSRIEDIDARIFPRVIEVISNAK